MRSIVFFVEEPSVKALLQQVLPRLFPELIAQYVVFEGKQDMEKRLEIRLIHWQVPNTRFVIIRDQDSEDCILVKERLLQKCSQSGKKQCLVRIICHELETWYLGDLNAVAKAFNIPKIVGKQATKKYRQPDLLSNPKQELQRLVPEYQPIDGSRRIGTYLDLRNNRSHSFGVFIRGIEKILA
jgi:hypothetical protein